MLYELRGHHAKITALAYSPDGKTLASAGSADESVCIWNLADGSLLHVFEGKETLECVAYSLDGQILAIGSHSKFGKIQLRDVYTGKRIRPTFDGWYNVHSLAWSPDRQLLLSGLYDQVFLWNARTGKRIKRFWSHTPKASTVHAVAFNPDGQTFASGSSDKQICIYSLEELEVIHRWTAHEKAITCIAYSPDGRVLASGGEDGTVRLWQLHTPPS